MNIVDYAKYIQTLSYHNNLDLEVINKLYEKQLIICGTRKFWNDNGRKVVGQVEEIEIPVYKYRYINTATNKPVTYADMTQRELKQVVKVGIVERQPYISGYKKLELISIDNTEGSKFDTKEYDVNLIKLMQECGTYDMNKLAFILIEEAQVQKELRLDIEGILTGLMENSGLIEYPRNDFVEVCEQLIKIFNIIDTKLGRRKLIDLKRESLDELADNIICTIEARNLRRIIGGAD